MQVIFSVEARQELEEAEQYYDRQIPSLGGRFHGAEKSSKPAHNYAVIEDFCSRLEVLPYTAKAAQHYGSIRAALEKTGQPIGVNYIHIAAHARSEGLVLVTNNLCEFERVPALLLENWVVNV